KVSEPGSHSRTTWPTVGRGVTAGMLGPMPAAISVIVPARDAGDGIDALCDALAAQTLARERFEVVVVDDGSRDATADRAEGHALRPRVVRRPRPGGSYAARNDGLAAAGAGLIAFTDSDCLPEPGWLAAGLARLEGGAGLVAGAVRLPLRERPSLAEAL